MVKLRTTLGFLVSTYFWACTEVSPSHDGRPCGKNAACIAGYTCNPVTNICERDANLCIDADEDGYGEGPGCLGPDCDDASGTCNVDCVTNTDGDVQRDCDDVCLDADNDGFGVGVGCAGTDCDDTSTLCTTTCVDTDGDTTADCKDTCLDVDHDGLGSGFLGNVGCLVATTDNAPNNPNVCADADDDNCDDCAIVRNPPDPDNDGVDTDNDGACNAGDTCTDSDGDGLGTGTLGNAGCTNTATDTNDVLATACADTDGDSCDDCISGTFATANDGADNDSDGLCDVGDPDDDNDGVNDGTDANPTNPFICQDADGDTCDDCSVTGGPADATNDGTDTDTDGDCDTHDADDDNDGVADGADANPTNRFLCQDTDADTCDDCSITGGPPNTLNDGTDTDGDGECNNGDNDDDGDSVIDSSDSAPLNRFACRDQDTDSCDDCSVTGGPPSTSNDGTDADSDGRCATTDCNDNLPFCTTTCVDLDNDKRCGAFDCNDRISTCTTDCATNTDSAGESPAVVNCVESYCGSDPNSTASVCLIASSLATLNTAITTANGTAATQDHILIASSGAGSATSATITITANTSPALTAVTGADGITLRQVVGSSINVNASGNVTVLQLTGNNSTIDGLNFFNDTSGNGNLQTGIEIVGTDNQVLNCTINGYERRGIYVNGGARANVHNNVIRGGSDGSGTPRGGIVVVSSTDSKVVGNVIAQLSGAQDGIQITSTTNLFVDHNTIDDSGAGAINGNGINFITTASTNTCMRNNIVTSQAVGLRYSVTGNTWNTAAGCTGPLGVGPTYGNNANGNTANCDTTNCNACACLPAGTFWEFNIAPTYVGTNIANADFFCVSAAGLLNSGDDLSYDLNFTDAGNFNGSAPDIGGRESGSQGCP